jgi:c-di-GMP-binding flagellar brake protein YcgR
MLKERRRYPRVYFNLPIKVSDSGFDVVTETRNISGNGAYCSINKEIEPMTKLKVILLVPIIKAGRKILKKICCKGVVVRKEHVRENGQNSYNIGIFFYEIKESDRRALLSYIETSLSKTRL